MKISEVIEQLIRNDLQCVQAGMEEGDNWWFNQIMRGGFVGYEHQTFEEIIQEYEERFGVPAEEDRPVINNLKLK